MPRPILDGPFGYVVFVVLGALAGALLGGAANLLNSQVSPDFFRHFFFGPEPRPPGPADHVYLTLLAIGQGMLEGSSLGGLASILILTACVLARRQISPTGALRVLPPAILTAAICGFIGGIFGLILHQSIPNLFVEHSVWPDETYNFMPVGWAQGTIWGLYAGAPLGALVALRRAHATEAAVS